MSKDNYKLAVVLLVIVIGTMSCIIYSQYKHIEYLKSVCAEKYERVINK